MRVLVAQGAAERGGAERILLTLAQQLRHHDIETVIAFAAEGPFVREVEEAGVTVETLPPWPRFRDWRGAGPAIDALTEVIRTAQSDVVLSNGERAAGYGGWAAHRAGVPHLVWLHDAPLRSPEAIAVQVAMRAAPRAASIAGSSWMAERFESLLKMPVDVVRHGIDVAQPASPASIRAEAGWSDSAPIVALVGRLQRWKGADVLLRAGARLIRAGIDIRLAFIGGALYGWETDYARELPHLASDLGIVDRCWFAGHRADATDLMAGAEVVVHCSRRAEPLGLVVAEAMALQRPTIATRTRGPEELIDHRRTGLLVAPDDDRALATAIRELVENPALAQSLAAAGRTEVERRWSPSGMGDGFAGIIRESVETWQP